MLCIKDSLQIQNTHGVKVKEQKKLSHINGNIYMKETFMELNEEIDNSTIITGNFNTSLLIQDRKTRQNIDKEIENLNNTVEQMKLIDNRENTLPTTFFSSAHEFSDYNEMKLEIKKEN